MPINVEKWGFRWIRKGHRFHKELGSSKPARYTFNVSRRIDLDHGRFRNIVRGKVRENLRKYISQGELIGRQGKKTVTIPLPRIDIPRFRFGNSQGQGVGQGEGEVGDSIDQESDQEGKAGEAGEQPGEHTLEVEFSLEELANILGERLELPNIEKKGNASLEKEKTRYSGIRNVGPNSLRHFKRTFRETLRRQIASGTYDSASPILVPRRDDMRYRSWKTEPKPQANAAIIYMMDVSGSMGDQQKEIVRIESFWIDTWLRKQYDGIETRFIIHDAVAREVDRDTFFRTKESGGTMISSAYKMASKIQSDSFPHADWNVYYFHFSDGDNWSTDDTQLCVNMLRDQLLPAGNMFGYGQVESPYGSGQFIKDLEKNFANEDSKVITSRIANRDAIMDSIKDFLGAGR